jgi:DNA-binding NarL/FixJ family response regulator
MIVDDKASARHGLRAVLGTFAEVAIVGEARNGREAVAEALERRPDVVLMDIRMPEMSGVDACRRIKKANPAIGVVLMTIHSDRAVEAVSIGDAVLSKGCALETLECVLREVASRRKHELEGRLAS